MKKDYIQQLQIRAFSLGCIIALILGLWQLKFGLGLLLGLIISQINFLIRQNYVDELLFRGSFALSLFMFNTMLNYGLMILAFTIAVIWPQYFSIYMVGLGLLVLKLVLYLSEVKSKKKGSRP